MVEICRQIEIMSKSLIFDYDSLYHTLKILCARNIQL